MEKTFELTEKEIEELVTRGWNLRGRMGKSVITKSKAKRYLKDEIDEIMSELETETARNPENG